MAGGACIAGTFPNPYGGQTEWKSNCTAITINPDNGKTITTYPNGLTEIQSPGNGAKSLIDENGKLLAFQQDM